MNEEVTDVLPYESKIKSSIRIFIRQVVLEFNCPSRWYVEIMYYTGELGIETQILPVFHCLFYVYFILFPILLLS